MSFCLYFFLLATSSSNFKSTIIADAILLYLKLYLSRKLESLSLSNNDFNSELPIEDKQAIKICTGNNLSYYLRMAGLLALGKSEN